MILMKRNAVIALENVSFSYDGVRRVLKDISFEVSEGERVAVLGRNGSGKSTLVKISGALQIPSRGACFVCGRNTSGDVSEIRGRVSLVFQDPESQIVASVVEDDVAFGPENQGLAPEDIEQRVTRALEKTGLSRRRKSLSSALSGGEKQRLALAGALASLGGETPCLILDEPASMLDPEGRRDVENILRELHSAGTTIVQVTHRREDTLHSDRVITLSDEPAAPALPSLPPSGRPTLSVRKIGHSPYFEIIGLRHRFDASTPFEAQADTQASETLKGISCVLPKGWVSVVGRTGSGKSTLVQHLNGLYGIQSGEILIEREGRMVPLPRRGPEVRNLRRRVGLVFQSPEDQLFAPTVREELAFAPRNWNFSEEDTQEAVARAMESVGLDESFLERNPLRLSGGERRLVAIASVLAALPECLVLDEPTAGLDEHYRGKILRLLSRMRDAGKTVVTVTHDSEMAFGFSDAVLVMDDGRLSPAAIPGMPAAFSFSASEGA